MYFLEYLNSNKKKIYSIRNACDSSMRKSKSFFSDISIRILIYLEEKKIVLNINLSQVSVSASDRNHCQARRCASVVYTYLVMHSQLLCSSISFMHTMLICTTHSTMGSHSSHMLVHRIHVQCT